MVETSTLIALAGLVLTLVALVGGMLYRQGKIEGKVDLLLEDAKEMREEFRREIRELREENRHNHQQLLQALAHHTHDPDTGFAIFRLPPGMENPAA